MQKDTSPRAVSGTPEQPGRAAKSAVVRRMASTCRLPSQPNATDERPAARDIAAQPLAPDIAGDRLEMDVIEMQIDNIHLELDTQMSRTAQLETLLIGIKDELHELIEMVKWLQHEVLNKPASVVRISRKVLH